MTEKKPLGLIFLPPTGSLPAPDARQVDMLRDAVPALDWRQCRDKDEFTDLLPEAEAALVWAFSSKWNDRAGRLRVVSTPAAGRELIRVERRPGLEVLFGAFHGELMAETVVGFMLSMVRGIRHAYEPMRQGGWPRAEVADGMRPLRGSHAVILGFGHIGKWIGRLLKPFGVRVTGVNRSNLERPAYCTEEDRVTTLAELDAVLPGADHLIMVLPGDPENDGMMDARRLGLLPRHAYVYNVGRGNALDLEALADRLEAGELAGAGLDVFPEEPLQADARIRGCPRVLLTPHTSAFAPGYLDLYIQELAPRLGEIFGTSVEE